jgi:hypothetical protein
MIGSYPINQLPIQTHVLVTKTCDNTFQELTLNSCTPDEELLKIKAHGGTPLHNK